MLFLNDAQRQTVKKLTIFQTNIVKTCKNFKKVTYEIKEKIFRGIIDKVSLTFYVPCLRRTKVSCQLYQQAVLRNRDSKKKRNITLTQSC